MGWGEPLKRKCLKILVMMLVFALPMSFLLMNTAAIANVDWDRSSLSFNGPDGGGCGGIFATVTNGGDQDMEGTSSFEVYWSPNGNPKDGEVVDSGTISALAKGMSEQLTFNPNGVKGNYKFKAYQRTGHPGTGELWSDTVSVSACPSISITKSANVETANPGDTVTYTFSVTNTGDVELTNVTVTDSKLPSGWNGSVGNLAAGATHTLTGNLDIPIDYTEESLVNEG